MIQESKETRSGGIFKVRPSGVLIEDGRLLLLRQAVTAKRHWSLPGGALEHGETIEHCLVRELKEETGLEVKVGDLLYVTDRITGKDHVVHMTFLVSNGGTGPLPMEWTHLDPSPTASGGRVREVRMVPIGELETYGFGPAFPRLVRDGFPGRGAYKGMFERFYGAA
jgi:ADP-ribose pyrophosphatase YjhB (NUDIX family)